MDSLQVILLALVQGITEFLPISSSAHLILVPHLLGWQDQGLAFDVAVHVGTLAAVVFYFRTELARMAVDWGRSCAGRGASAEARLAWLVILATIPVVLAGLFLHRLVEHELRAPLVIAFATIGFGVLLWLADRLGRQIRTTASLGVKDAILIGLAQVLALIPGTSRSGITMTAALALGLSRTDAARFSFLLSIPTILMAGGYESWQLLSHTGPVDWGAILLGTALAAISAWLSIHFFLRLIERIGMWPFVAYRLVLGMVLLWVFW